MTDSQHYRVSLPEAIMHYQSGDLTAKGLLHFYFKIRIAPGWTLKETQKETCEKLGISRAAFYSALSKLKAEGSINWSAPANTKFSISLAVCERGQESMIVDNQSTYIDTTSAYIDSESANVDDQSKIVDEKSSKPAPSKGSEASSNSSSNFSSTSLSESEREKNLQFWNEQTEEARSILIAIAKKFFLPKLPTQPTLPLKWIECNCLEIHSFWQKNPDILHTTEDPNLGENSGNSPARELYAPKDWEIAPGVPYPAFKEERIAYYCHKGEPIEAATAKAGADLRNPLIAADLWEGFLRKCDRLADEAIKAKDRGCTPYLPPSFTPKAAVTKESITTKLQAAFPGTPAFSETPKPPQIEQGNSQEEEDFKPTIEQLQKALNTTMGRSFALDQIEANPQWGYAIVDGQVVEVEP